MTITVSILRHGETAHNVLKIIQGSIDTSLNKKGEEQARVTGRYLRDVVTFHEAWSSDLCRASKTAELVMQSQRSAISLDLNAGEAQKSTRASLQLDPRIQERFLGELQGKRWGDDGANRDSPSIETATVLSGRLLSFWHDRFPPQAPSQADELLDPPDPAKLSLDRQVLLVSHGGAIRMLVASLLKLPNYTVDLPPEHQEQGTDRRVANCSITQFVLSPVRAESGEWQWHGRLVKYADDSHFTGSEQAPVEIENVDIMDDAA